MTAPNPVIILIEDDSVVAQVVSRHLQREGWIVRRGDTIAAGRELVADGGWDLVILDRRLPDGDGFELCRDLRKDYPRAYLLMLTGEASEEAKLAGFEVGADDYVTKSMPIPELMARVRAGLRIVELQKALLASNRQLEELSLRDGLTSLRNRRAFEQELATAYAQARRYDRPLSLAIVDVDHFKVINDSIGHTAGDAVLRAVAQLLEHSTRQSDFVARVGGEEFAVLLPETALFDSMQFAEKIRATIASSTIRTGDVAHRVTVSIGIASIPHSRTNDAAELYHAADQALYRAKNGGRNRVEIERRRERANVRAVARHVAASATTASNA
ncbi:MAG TPA: diguanylate cyclase [Thermoanaerobaculia bacterium]|nr:diguanylate cyclase [Thermoanaerobaculia bacterium]